ncbi:SRPBCC family protein [Allokutzneria sp. A3M-2-11 16]|uniref:SRPBCC family protein n=1 Tax=Allokutzneria sp. A3M-2-11 16 TaxID=2962043 RepID=UPI0020B7D8C2|nr:SRPBCC family protein [Allokutzneria sp. A3M-2-11 16]MCP3803770.1 SRPBCC family protein [Allokutzneria sp. A3M-2-11 16]
MSDPMVHRARLEAGIAEVRRALTEPEALRVWLAEHVEVDLPHRFQFWGRHTPEGEEPRQRLLHADDSGIGFVWPLAGKDTTVTIALAEDEDGSTILTLSQTELPGFPEMLTDGTSLGLMHTFWALAVANLGEYLEGRELTPKCDFSTPVMREQVTVAASPRTVYESLMDPATFARWFGANIEVEPHVGGRWAMGSFEMDTDPARIIALEPGARMAMRWPNGMVADWELEGSEGRTRLTFVQSGFDESNPPYDAWMGWLSGVAELRRFHEVPDWRPCALTVEVEGMPEGLLSSR